MIAFRDRVFEEVNKVIGMGPNSTGLVINMQTYTAGQLWEDKTAISMPRREASEEHLDLELLAPER